MSITRRLTEGEIKLAQSIFKDSVNYDHVSIHSGRLMGPMHKDNFAKTTLLSQIFMHNLYKDDFSKAQPGLQGLFIHEMTHVWQGQQMAFSYRPIDLKNMISYTRKAYDYALTGDKDLLDYGTEQQASIVADYFGLQRRNNAEPAKLNLYKKTLKNFLENPSYAKFSGVKRLLGKLFSPPKP